MIYKILTQTQWHAFQAEGVFKGAPVDLADGYLHFSSHDTVKETAQKHFAGLTDLWLIAVDETSVKDHLKWEVSRGGALFPHLYAPLLLAQVLWAKPLPFFFGRHVFPEGY
jgi:uncharacterized protein (DUF952 family)